MRRGFCATLLVVGCAILPLRSVCLAQITFIPGLERSVANGPQFAAAADFDGDGIADVVVSDTIADKITILFGSSDGVFKSAVDRQVGNLLRGVATGNFNGDHDEHGAPIQDIAVVDVNLSRVFILAGDGHGAFNPTGNFLVDRKGPYGVAVGNFDNKNGPDIVTANSAANSLTVLFNLGRNSGFSAAPNIPIGKSPRPVGTADFNGDGLDDIVVVNTGSAGTDQLTILLNNGVGSFQSSVPQNFVVGKGARALTIADFNDDGIPDVAVLNGTAIAPNTFSISVLINQTILGPDNKPIGTGFFNVQQGTQLTCPPNIKLVPVSCTPRDIKSGDFDGDGFNDLVVSVSTAATNSNSTTAGFVTAFAGRGDGTFDFGTLVLVGVGPREMAIADFTGDGSPDIALTEYTEDKVRILRSVAPPPRPNGDSCRLGTQCASTFCVDHTCCGRPSCPAGEVCSVPEFPGQCHTPNPNGGECTDPAQCQSNFCVDGACCGTQTCPPGQFCNTGQCGPPSDPGTHCTDGQQCNTGFCVDLICCTTITCPANQRCNIPGSEGMCTMTADPGTPCTDGGQCTSGFCTDGVCCASQICQSGQVCNAPGNEGQCVPAPTRTPTPTATPTSTTTPTPQPTGAPCSAGTQCQSGNCVNNTCCGSSSCPNPQRCDISGSSGVCTAPKTPGGSCSKDADCTTQNCDPITLQCGLVKTATPTPTQTPRDPGAPCTNASQCPDGYFCSTDERVCCTSSSCPSGESCKVSDSPGDCTTVPTPTPTPTVTPTLTPKQGPGQTCDPNTPDICDSGLFCDPISSVCCDTDNCLDPNRCDIFASEGNCSPPLLEGDQCAKNTDCEGPLVCAFNGVSSRFECSVPPTPLPTFIPFTPEPTPLGPIVNVSRSGGCSIGSGPDGSQLWAVCALPLLLWLRRSRLQRVPVRNDDRGRRQ